MIFLSLSDSCSFSNSSNAIKLFLQNNCKA
jgi:hypothetical protein